MTDELHFITKALRELGRKSVEARFEPIMQRIDALEVGTETVEALAREHNGRLEEAINVEGDAI